jgi:hypothetical protein
MVGERHGNGMGTAWERYGMCESAFRVAVCPVTTVLLVHVTREMAALRNRDLELRTTSPFAKVIMDQ